MTQVLGVGGVFLKCKDVEATKHWYQNVLGMSLNDFGGFDFAQDKAVESFGNAARTIFAPFGPEADYFAPSELPFMLNLMVDDLDGMLERVRAADVALLQPPETYSYGKFAWIMDPDGRKLELWQPFREETVPTDGLNDGG